MPTIFLKHIQIIHSKISPSFSNYTPWVRGVSIHCFLFSSSEMTIADLVAPVIMPEDLNYVFTFIAKVEPNWFICVQRSVVLPRLKLGQSSWCRMLSCPIYLNFEWSRLVFIAVIVQSGRSAKGDQSCDSVYVFHHVYSKLFLFVIRIYSILLLYLTAGS